ncbi:MAG: PepSY domain-containing protein [Flavobacteriaceae bacterium]
MTLNNRKISNRVRSVHRYLGFFLAGIMFMYSLTGITLIFRDSDTFKREVRVEKQLEKNLEKLPKLKGAKNINYNKTTGVVTYSQMKSPKILGLMEKIHKAKSSDPLYFFNIFFGLSLLFFVVSSYWMFLPQTAVFKKAIYFTLAGISLAAFMLLI